jgi:hypothetical protein
MRYATIAAAALLVSGCKQPQAQNPAAAALHSPLSQNGRYTIVHSPHIQRDTVLLDTVTGQTWQLVTFSYLPNEPSGWTPMAREDRTDEMDALRAANPPSRKTTPTKGDTASWERGTDADRPPWEENSGDAN